VGYLVELDDPPEEFDDELDAPVDEEPFDELCDEFEGEVVFVDGAGETAGLVGAVVGDDGLVVRPLNVVGPVEALVVPAGPGIVG
jgi:hypothetical protein